MYKTIPTIHSFIVPQGTDSLESIFFIFV